MHLQLTQLTKKSLAELKRLKRFVDYAIVTIELGLQMVKTTPKESAKYLKSFDMVIGPYGIQILQ